MKWFIPSFSRVRDMRCCWWIRKVECIYEHIPRIRLGSMDMTSQQDPNRRADAQIPYCMHQQPRLTPTIHPRSNNFLSSHSTSLRPTFQR